MSKLQDLIDRLTPNGAKYLQGIRIDNPTTGFYIIRR